MRLWTLVIKRWILSYRQIFLLLGFILGPLIIEIIAIGTLPSPISIQASLLQNERVKGGEVTLIPSIYNPQTIVINSNERRNQVLDYLRNYLTSMGATIREIDTPDVLNYVISRNNDSYNTFVNKYQMSFSIYQRSSFLTLNIFYSTVNYHAMAVGLNTATTTLFQYYANSSIKRIRTTNQPIVTSSESLTSREIFFDRLYCFDTIPLSLLNVINSVIATIFTGILAMNVIRERISRSKNLQLLTSTSKKLYWLSNFLYDFTLCLIVSGLLTAVVKVKQRISKNIDIPNRTKVKRSCTSLESIHINKSLGSTRIQMVISYSFPEKGL